MRGIQRRLIAPQDQAASQCRVALHMPTQRGQAGAHALGPIGMPEYFDIQILQHLAQRIGVGTQHDHAAAWRSQ